MVTDLEAIEQLKLIAVGRNPAEMAPLMHAAHEAICLEDERQKYAALVDRRSQTMSRGAVIQQHGQIQFDDTMWDDMVSHVTDGEGTNHIDVILGLVWKAIFLRDQNELELQLYSLLKASHKTFPHAKLVVERELQKG